MVTLQILVLSFLVRIQVAQQEKRKGRYGYRISLSVIRVRPRLVRAAAHAPMHDGLGQETAECRMECRRPIRKTAAITTAVRISDRGRASQMPTAPNALGEQNKARYQKHESAQHGKTRSRQHLPDALVIPYHGKVRNKENEPRPQIPGNPSIAIRAAISPGFRKSPTSCFGRGTKAAVATVPHIRAAVNEAPRVACTRSVFPMPALKLIIGWADCAMAFPIIKTKGR